MNNYQSKPRASGAGGWGGPKKFGAKKPWDCGGGDSRSEDRPMFQATCSECGNACRVPFKPVSGRPIFCQGCFKRDDDQAGSFDRRPLRDKPARDFSPRDERPAPRPSADRSEEAFKAINAKLDAITNTLAAMNLRVAEASEAPKKVVKKTAAAKKK